MFVAAQTLDDLLNDVFNALLKAKSRVKATRGSSAELVGMSLELSNARARLSHSEKKGKVFSGLGEWLWYLTKSDKLDFIEYYLPRYREDSSDGKTLFGAYGPRLFKMRGLDQFITVQRMLERKPTTRRAVIQLFDPNDIAKERLEIPCTCTLQFLIRNDELQLVAHMRSNDAFLGLPHDVFAFTMLQEMMAVSLGVEVGAYRHLVGSMHLYDENRPQAEAYLSEGWQPTKDCYMPRMPAADPWPAIRKLLRFESALRSDVTASVPDTDSYWQDLARLLKTFALSKNRKKFRPQIKQTGKEMVSPVYSQYIARRVSQPMPTERQLRITFSGPAEKQQIPRWLVAETKKLATALTTDERLAAAIPWSSPVPIFGDIRVSKIATVSLNPSNLEFENGSGEELVDDERRLETLQSLELASWEDVSAVDVRKVVRAFLGYFRGRPYDRWFKSLEDMLELGGTSYRKSKQAGCHIDLVPYATAAKWTTLTTATKRGLLEASQDCIGRILASSEIALLVLNGSRVVRAVEELSGESFRKSEMQSWTLPRASGDGVVGTKSTGKIHRLGKESLGREIQVVGFNHNLQSSFGVTTKVKHAISRTVAREIVKVLE